LALADGSSLILTNGVIIKNWPSAPELIWWIQKS
jgi:hypothetical protein